MGLSHAPRVITDGLVLGLDAANTRSYVGSGTTWTDLIGSNNGTLTNGPVFTQEPKLEPFGGAGAVEFDGSGDALQIPNTTDTNFGTGDFTVEAWIKTGSTASPAVIIGDYGSPGAANGWIFRQDAVNYPSGNYNKLELIVFDGSNTNGYQVTGTSIITDNEWHHVAATREGTTIKVFVDGVQEASATNSFNISSTQDTYIGMLHNGAFPFDGYISNLRVIKGTALYTSNFTPPRKKLEATSDTVLLTCEKGTIRDRSSSAHAITVTGDAHSITGASYFKFDGTNDYVGAPVYIPTEDASIEVWARIDIFEGNVLFGFGGDDYPGGLAGSGPDVYISGGTWAWNTGDGTSNAFSANPTVNTTDWFHYVVTTESASNAKLYVNGILIGTANHKSAQVTNSGDRVIIGRWANTTGYETPGNYSIVRVYDRVLSLSEIQQNFNALRGRYGI